MTKQNLWASALYWICQVCSSNDKEAAKSEHTLAQFNGTILSKVWDQFNENWIGNKAVILRLSRKAMKFLGTYSIQDVLKQSQVSLQLKNQSLSVNMGNKNLCVLLNVHMVNLGACLQKDYDWMQRVKSIYADPGIGN